VCVVLQWADPPLARTSTECVQDQETDNATKFQQRAVEPPMNESIIMLKMIVGQVLSGYFGFP
jgi:hypothetical protein